MEKLDFRSQVKILEREDQTRRRRELVLIAVISLLLVVFILLQLKWGTIAEPSAEVPFSTSLLFLILWDFVFVLVILLVFLVLRNIVKLIFERRSKMLGASLRTKLVVAFVSLTLGPTIILFMLASFFLNYSIERWFDPAVARIFRSSKEIVHSTYNITGEQVLNFATNLSTRITKERLLRGENSKELETFLREKQKEYRLGMIEVFSADGDLVLRIFSEDVPNGSFSSAKSESVKRVLTTGEEGYFFEPAGEGDLIRVWEPIFSSWEKKQDVVGALVINYYLPKSLKRQLESNLLALDEYQRLEFKEIPIRRQYYLFLVLITLAVIFLAIWFGFYLSKGITVPIQLLAEGTQAIAKGDLSWRIDISGEDDVAMLGRSFNKMTEDLAKSRSELEQRKAYMETILSNIDAGVIALDEQGRVEAINQSALKMLGLSDEVVFYKELRAFVPEDFSELIERMDAELGMQDRGTVVREEHLSFKGRWWMMRVSLSWLRDREGHLLGKVLVLEDLTELLRAQRALAWREVARRIAHEIKNPLTPIQLSAQRLLKHYEEDGESREMVKECAGVIIRQVDAMKHLVDQFSSFARLPSLEFKPGELNEVLRDVFRLYQGQADVEIELDLDPKLPVFSFDANQLKSAVINLLDNAIASLKGRGGKIGLCSRAVDGGVIRIEVSDTGPGVQEEDRERIFEPYYSTKPHGTGLGLAIVKRIVEEHNGRVWVEPNSPRGARFIIELALLKHNGKGVA